MFNDIEPLFAVIEPLFTDIEPLFSVGKYFILQHVIFAICMFKRIYCRIKACFRVIMKKYGIKSVTSHAILLTMYTNRF